jgi:hypothetical protein
MQKVLIAAFVALWGAAILITKVVHLGPYSSPHGGGYGTGQIIALMIASIMVVGGAYQVRRGLLERDGDTSPLPRVDLPSPITSTAEAHERSAPPPARRS